MYLKTFSFPDDGQEFDFLLDIKRRCYDTFYPFKILSAKRLDTVEFEPITIFYGGNGSGKTTALNIIAEKLNIKRTTPYNRSSFYSDYLNLCQWNLLSFSEEIPAESQIIVSDDVFDYMLNIRMLNQGIDLKREQLFDDYLDRKYASFKMKSLKDYDTLKKNNLAKSKTQSKYVRHELIDNIREYSNGENAFRFFTENITENALFLLDEPENSLSPENQLKLKQFLEDSARFYGCQLIIATHSPFLLAMKGAKIYDLEGEIAQVKDWTQLKNVNVFRDFFKAHEDDFK